MISFRFHLISITAVFLGIAIGVIVGSTFVDRAIVDGLQDRIDSVSANLDQRREEAEALQSELDRLRSAHEANAAFAVTDRLAGDDVMVIVGRGVEEDAVNGVVELARQAGGTVPGVLWVEPALADLDADEVAELAALAGIESDDADEVRAALWAALGAELAAPGDDTGTGGEGDGDGTGVPDPGTGPGTGTDPGTDTGEGIGPDDTTGSEGTGTTVLDALADSPYLTFEPATDGALPADLAGRGPLVLVGTGPQLEDGIAGLLGPLTEELATTPLGTVIAEAYEEPAADVVDPPARGASAAALRTEGLATIVSTIDHLDFLEGQVAAVLTLADIRDGIVGSYGYGDGTSGPSPAWRPLA